MDESYNKVGFLVVLFVLVALVMVIKKYMKSKQKELDALAAEARSRHANQTADIWNISGRVNHQDGPVTSEPQRWPTHDHHVSLDSFVIPETHQRNKKDRIPPPPYSEVDLPTYEEATALPRPKDELASVHVVPSQPSSSRTVDASTTS